MGKEPDVIDVKFTVVKPAKLKKRPKGGEDWTEAEFQAWRKLPLWKRYELTFNWPYFVIIAAIALAAFARKMAEL